MKFIKELWNSIKNWKWIIFTSDKRSTNIWTKFIFETDSDKEKYNSNKRKNKTIPITFIILISIALLVLLAIFYSDIASFFFVEKDPNGEFLKVLLSFIGGIGLFYGLFINSRRIQEQTRQNNISECSNSDKRFVDAIGLINNLDNKPTVTLGGIYALNQLAKEDSRYKSIVLGIFTSYIREQSKRSFNIKDFEKEPIDNEFIEFDSITLNIQTIIDLILQPESIYYGDNIDLSECYFRNITFTKGLTNVSFSFSYFHNCIFDCNINNCEFYSSYINFCKIGHIFSKLSNSNFLSSKIKLTVFIGNSLKNVQFDLSTMVKSSFLFEEINNCNFREIKVLEFIEFHKVSSFCGTIFNLRKDKKIRFINCFNLNEIRYC